MTWVNFKALREKLDFAAVLKHYNVELKTRKGDQMMGPCPLPTHPKDRRSPSFSANIERGIWQCFDPACKGKGNALDFCVRMEGRNPASGQDVRTVALKVQTLFGIESEAPKPAPPKPESRKPSAPAVSPTASSSPARPPIVNAPLDFELKDLDPAHPYLAERGFTPETIVEFGLGYCTRGAFKDRIAIPLHDAGAQLVGYAGRLVDDRQIRPDNPKYKFPASRLRDDEVHELHKSLFLYNGHRILKPVSDLVVVEGFPSVWWLHQNGIPIVVGLMGDSCSAEQAALIVVSVIPDGRVWMMSDGDQAGERCAASVLTQVAAERFVRWVKLVKNQQPTDLSLLELGSLLPVHSPPAKKKRARKTTATDSAPASGSASV